MEDAVFDIIYDYLVNKMGIEEKDAEIYAEDLAELINDEIDGVEELDEPIEFTDLSDEIDYT